ncbi:MAG: tetratricopeptide repeat protein [Elusimicrobia bacterium]|nr:tetratricopeptide repeat protein [Elusimicrobiota bacterium]
MAATQRLAAVMFSDIFGYSKMMAEDEPATLGLLDEHNSLLVPIITRHGGRALKFVGDAILSVYPSAVDATRCAIATQEALEARNAARPGDKPLVVRIGLHVGDVTEKDGDAFGSGVNIAARLQALAPPGGICLSSAVRDMVAPQLDVEIADMGEHRLKNIAGRHRLFAIGGGAESPARRLRRAAPWLAALLLIMTLLAVRSAFRQGTPSSPLEMTGTRLNVVVAPFLGAGEAAKDGLVLQSLLAHKLEELMEEDAAVMSLKLPDAELPRTHAEARAILKRAGAHMMLWGEIAASGGETRLRSFVTLADERRMWANMDSDAVREGASPGFGAKDAVMHEAGALALLSAADLYRESDPIRALGYLKRLPDVSPYNQFLRGLILCDKGETRRCAETLERAVRLKPGLGLAWMNLGKAYAAEKRWPEAEAALEKAAALEPQDARAWFYLGLCRRGRGRTAAAREALERAAALDPDDAETRRRLAEVLAELGRGPEAARESAAALKLDKAKSAGYPR